jgi:hypothetical protein
MQRHTEKLQGKESKMAESRNDFEQEAARGRSTLAGEFIHLLANNKKWWLLPILLCLAILAALVFLGGTGASPFIYTIF